MNKKIILIAGARPNFMKIAPLTKHLSNFKIISTGQHYDKMTQDDLLPEIDFKLNIHSSSYSSLYHPIHRILKKEKPALVIVVGDVNSSLAGANSAHALNIPLAHVEAGLRSFDDSMPEEINRIEIDKISDYLFVSEPSGVKNLRDEGITKNVFLVGNTMIDSLIEQQYAVLTLHRPSNVDRKNALEKIIKILTKIDSKIKIICPLHPRTNQALKKFSLHLPVETIDPLPYSDFIKLVKGAKFVLTDSGGIQEETSFLNIPCLTMRENTERPITLEKGSNLLVGSNEKKILKAINQILIPRIWDGHASERICKIINSI